MTRPGATIILLAAATSLVVAGTIGANAQVTLPPLLPTTTTTTTQPGAPPPPPTSPPTTASLLGNILKPLPTPVPTTAAPVVGRPPADPTRLPGNAGGEGLAPPPEAGPFPADLAAMMNSVRRTGPRNSYALVDALKALTDMGVPAEEAMRMGMGRFPVAGRASYSHDWWYPRFGPGWRLHQGTDVFGERGTPLRSPTTGMVRFGDGGLGGISTYITQADGTYFYLAHLEGRPPGLANGQTVNTGDIVGYLGSTGNAAGGSPHLHFEVHPAIRFVTVGKGKKRTTKAVSAPVRPGTVLPAIDPKPLLDLYLAEAMAQLPAIVAAYQAQQPAVTPAAAGPAVPNATAAVAGRHLAVGGLIAAEAPLARTPLLLLAFLLVVMVAALTPVLAPTRSLVGAHPFGRHAAEKRGRRRGGRSAPPPPPSGPPSPVVPSNGPAGAPADQPDGTTPGRDGAGSGGGVAGGGVAGGGDAAPRDSRSARARRRRSSTTGTMPGGGSLPRKARSSGTAEAGSLRSWYRTKPRKKRASG